MIIYREQAETLFRLHPDYSGVQVEIHDKREALLVSSGAEINSPRSRARAELMMSVFRIHAVAYLRLVDNMNFHEAYSVLLDDLVRDMWSGYVKLDRKLFDSVGGIDQDFIRDLRLEERHWKTEGHRRIDSLRKTKVDSNVAAPSASTKAEAERVVRPAETVGSNSVASQIEQLRVECRLTVEQLADKMKLEPRSVYRHLAGTKPRIGHLGAYENVFSELLGRKVVISDTSAKRQANVIPES